MKINKVFALLTLSSALLLTSCKSKIYAKPNNNVMNQQLIKDSNVEHNTVEWLYDTLHNKNSSYESVENAIYGVLEEGLFGKFELGDNLNIILKGYDGESDSNKLEFVKKHKAYWDKAKIENTNKYDYQEPTTLTETIKIRVDIFKNLIKEAIVSELYEEANKDTYKTRNYFYEVKFARTLRQQNNNINTSENIFDTKFDEENNVFTNKVLIDNTISVENINSVIGNENSYKKPILHINLYKDYINESILPKILKKLAIEQYVYDYRYAAISRTQYRQVKYIKIDTQSKNIADARKLINTFVNKYIKDAKVNEEIDFNLLADAWKGVYSKLYKDGKFTDTGKLLLESGFKNDETPTKDGVKIKCFADGKNVSEYPYFKNTRYGDLIEEYGQITLNPKTTNKSIESSFTNDGTYSILTGLDIKINELMTKSYTVNTWGEKSKEFDSLPDDIKKRLFDYTVSVDHNLNNLDNNSYLTSINGHYFLKSSVSQDSELSNSIVIKNDQSFYIVEVIEAPSQAKLTIGGQKAYDNTAASNLKQERVSRKIGYEIAKNGSYNTAALTYYLKNAKLKFHDQDLYDYFKNTYKDLFKKKKNIFNK